MISALVIQKYDVDRDGKFSALETKTIEGEHFSHLKAFHYFLELRVGGVQKTVTAVRDFEARNARGRLHYLFTAPLVGAPRQRQLPRRVRRRARPEDEVLGGTAMHVPASRTLIPSLVLAALCVAAPGGAAGNPFAVTPDRPSPAPRLGEGGTVPAVLRPLVDRIAATQRQLNRTLSRELREVRESGSPAAVLLVTGVAFLYGVLHAAGPGHGKLVVSSFFLAREARIGGGILAGTAISFLQAVTSIVIVSFLAVALGQHGVDVLGRSVWLEAVSYALVIAIGLLIAVTAVRGGHDHEGAAGGRVGVGMVIAAGLTPCASALIIMLFALGHGVFLVGVGATLVMAVGMSLTVSLVGILAILGRRTIMVALPGHQRLRSRVSIGLSLGGVSIAILGTLLLAGVWGRLG